MPKPSGSYGPGRAIEAEIDTPVVIVLDMAKGYGWLPGSYGYDPMVPNCRRLIDAAHVGGVQVIHVTSARRESDNLPRPSEATIRNMSPEGQEVIPELALEGNDIQLYKRFLSGFYANDLEYTLRTLGCDCVILAGASTDNCVLWTAMQAFEFRYKVVVAEDCTIVHGQARTEAGAKEAALTIIRGVLQSEVIPLNEVIKKYLQPR
jgi:nicotinamidase-related amidase